MIHSKRKRKPSKFTSSSFLLEKFDHYHRIWSHTNEHHAHFMRLFQTCLSNQSKYSPFNANGTNKSIRTPTRSTKHTTTTTTTVSTKLPSLPTYVKIKDIHSKEGFKLVPRYMTPFSSSSSSSTSSSFSTLKRKTKLLRTPGNFHMESQPMRTMQWKQEPRFQMTKKKNNPTTSRNPFVGTTTSWLQCLYTWFHSLRSPSSSSSSLPLVPSSKTLTGWQRQPAFQWLSKSTLNVLCMYGQWEMYPQGTWISQQDCKEIKWYMVLQGEVEVYIAKSYSNKESMKKKTNAMDLNTSRTKTKVGVKTEVLKEGQAFGHLGTLMAGDLVPHTWQLHLISPFTTLLSVTKEEYLQHVHESYQNDMYLRRHASLPKGFHPLPSLDRDRIFHACDLQTLSKGSWIMHEQAPVSGLYWIQQGEVDIYRTCKWNSTTSTTIPSTANSTSSIASGSSSLASSSSSSSSVLVWVARKTVGEYFGEEGVLVKGTFNPNTPPMSLITAHCVTQVMVARLPLLLAKIKFSSMLTLSPYLSYSNSELYQVYQSKVKQYEWEKTKKKVLKELGRLSVH